MMSQHTPVPWKLHHEDAAICTVETYVHLLKNGKPRKRNPVYHARICQFDIVPVKWNRPDMKQARINAEFIVRACNSHTDLIVAAEDLLDHAVMVANGISEVKLEYLSTLAEAVDKAKGELV